MFCSRHFRRGWRFFIHPLIFPIWSWLCNFHCKAENYKVLLIFESTVYYNTHYLSQQKLICSLLCCIISSLDSPQSTPQSTGQFLTVECAYEDSDLANERDKRTNPTSACVRARRNWNCTTGWRGAAQRPWTVTCAVPCRIHCACAVVANRFALLSDLLCSKTRASYALTCKSRTQVEIITFTEYCRPSPDGSSYKHSLKRNGIFESARSKIVFNPFYLKTEGLQLVKMI